MAELKVVFWSGSGNTESMADLVVKGAGDAKAIPMEDISPADLAEEKAFALGCPAMGDEELEETIVEPFVAELEKNVAGKTIGLFGSYGWGDGEWMRAWVERMQNAGAEIVDGEGVICADAPDDEAEQSLAALGEKLAKALG
ncbi:MAG: flavodoxin domain-containing protein [Lachnospiraceae bacterium]|nr:flavodoxin domain-containing protein [Lachnospiraceae bacterium]